MDELAYYFVKIIEEDQKRQRQKMRSCFEDLEDNVFEMSEECPREEGAENERR